MLGLEMQVSRLVKMGGEREREGGGRGAVVFLGGYSLAFSLFDLQKSLVYIN